jgi:hypothetical protein
LVDIMSVKIVAGDLFNSGCDVLVNPVNCVGVMGALSGVFAQKFPLYAADYKTKCATGDINIGAVSFYCDGVTDKYIVSLPTMRFPGKPSKRSSILLGLEDLRRKLIEDWARRYSSPWMRRRRAGFQRCIRPGLYGVRRGLGCRRCRDSPVRSTNLIVMTPAGAKRDEVA